jgi:hypothetical protein
MGTDPVSPDLPLVALQTADEKVDHIENLRAAIAAATMQRDHHVAKTAEQIRNEQLDAEAERLAKELAAIQADAEQREIPLTGIAAMRAAAALVPDSGQPVREVTMDDGAVLAESGMGDEVPVATPAEAAVETPAEVPVVAAEPAAEPASDHMLMDLPDQEVSQ